MCSIVDRYLWKTNCYLLGYYYFVLIWDLQMGFQDVAFLPSQASFFSLRVLKIVVEDKSSGPPYVLKLWFGVSKGMFPVKCFCFKKFPFCIIVIF